MQVVCAKRHARLACECLDQSRISCSSAARKMKDQYDTGKMTDCKRGVSQHAFPSSICGESLSQILYHLGLRPSRHTLLGKRKREATSLSTIGMAGSDYWTELRQAACERGTNSAACLVRARMGLHSRGMYARG